MDLSSVAWLVVVLTSVILPGLQRWLTLRARSRLVARLERRRKSKVITLVHRQEAVTLLGIPIARYIDIEDSERVLRTIRAVPPDKPLDLILHTPGGLVLAAEQIAMALTRHRGPVTVFVPHYAMSGGTLLALAANGIQMDPNAVLGPVDPQLGEYPAASILKVRAQKGPEAMSDQTLILADLAEKAMAQVLHFMEGLLRRHLPEEEARQVARTLTEGRWTHDYPLTVDQVREMGLPVGTEIPDEVYALMGLFRQSEQRRPSLLQVPVPGGTGEGRNSGERRRTS